MRVFAIGASAGGVPALIELFSALPADFPAAVLVVQHVGSRPSLLPKLISARSRMPAAHAEQGQPVCTSQICVAPPDHHLLVADGRVILSHGPKEHFTRPAIDPLFRSAALAYGPALVGVVLTGMLDDGTAGLQAIKACGGTAVVQDPADAEEPSMPASALSYVDVDHCLDLPAMPSLFVALAAAPPGRAGTQAPAPAAALRHEHALTLGKEHPMEHLQAVASPCTFTCPECHGTLWRIRDARPERFRCHTGHAFTARSLEHQLAVAGEEASWNALRALQERVLFLEHLIDDYRSHNAEAAAAALEPARDKVARQLATLHSLVRDGPPPTG